MLRVLLALVFTGIVIFSGSAQTIKVNPDGTHSILYNNGSTATQVNPDGTHTVIFNNGSTATQVNPDGTHTVIFNNGSTATQVNPDGTHTVIFNNGSTATQVNPDGTHVIILNNEWIFPWADNENTPSNHKTNESDSPCFTVDEDLYFLLKTLFDDASIFQERNHWREAEGDSLRMQADSISGGVSE